MIPALILILAASLYALTRGCLIIFATELSGRDAAQAPFPTILLVSGGAIGAAVSGVALMMHLVGWAMSAT